MSNGFTSLVNPGTPVSDVDLNASRVERCRLHEEVSLRAHLLNLLSLTAAGDGLLAIEQQEAAET